MVNALVHRDVLFVKISFFFFSFATRAAHNPLHLQPNGFDKTDLCQTNKSQKKTLAEEHDGKRGPILVYFLIIHTFTLLSIISEQDLTSHCIRRAEHVHNDVANVPKYDCLECHAIYIRFAQEPD